MMARTLESRLLDLRRKVDEAKEEKAKLEGQIEQLETILRDEFNCSSLEEGQALLEKITEEVDKLTAEMEEELDAIESEHFPQD